MNREFLDAIEVNPIIAAVKDEQGFANCLRREELTVIFILYGDIRSIGNIVERIHQAGKIAMVHIDLVTGLSSKEVSVDYICEDVHADGIISTKASMINRAKKLGMYTVLRFFLIDSMAIKNIENLGNQHEQLPDVVEVLPGLMPKILKKICKTSRVPVIAGGLISDKEDVMGALGAGAAAVSTTNQEVWEL
jgi:glycerol uptake operon antiterminator